MGRNTIELHDGSEKELRANEDWEWPNAPDEDPDEAELIDTPTDAVRFEAPDGYQFEMDRLEFESQARRGFVEPIEQ